MFKIVVSSIVLLLLTGSGAFGGIFQGQTWGVGVNNDIHLQHSQQNGQSSQNVLINMSQDTNGGTAFGSAHVSGVSTQFGGGLLGASSLVSHAQLLSLGGLHAPLGVISPIGSSSMLMLGSHAGPVPW